MDSKRNLELESRKIKGLTFASAFVGWQQLLLRDSCYEGRVIPRNIAAAAVIVMTLIVIVIIAITAITAVEIDWHCTINQKKEESSMCFECCSCYK